MYCRIIAASFWCRGEKYNMFQNTVAYFFHGSTSAVRVLMMKRMSAKYEESTPSAAEISMSVAIMPRMMFFSSTTFTHVYGLLVVSLVW